MSIWLSRIYRYRDLIYKISIFLISIFILVSIFPKRQAFKHEIKNGQVWFYPDLIAPFDFALLKSSEEYSKEVKNIRDNKKYYFNKDQDIGIKAIEEFEKIISLSNKKDNILIKKGKSIIYRIYKHGYINSYTFPYTLMDNNIIGIKSGTKIINIPYGFIYTSSKVSILIDKIIPETTSLDQYYNQTLKNILSPNIYYNDELTQTFLTKKIKTISKRRGLIHKGQVIISKNEVVDNRKLQILSSLEESYNIQKNTKNNTFHLAAGQFLLIGTLLSIFFLYLFYFQKDTYNDDSKLTFLILSILLTAVITVKIISNYPTYLYLIPLCILPIIIQAFFTLEISITTHIINILVLSIIVPHHFDFILLQINAGLAVSLTKKTIYKRINLLVTIFKAIIIYMITYLGIALIRKEPLDETLPHYYVCFLFNGMLILFVQPLIYLCEKVFKLTSDFSLLELSDTKTPILRMLSQKAPGTLQHSLTVANLAEEAALETAANPLLTRIGALYHDIGKIENSIFFTENQLNISDPHEELSPEESAQIILNHVSLGIRLAKEHHLPDRVIDFIRTHHGDSLVYYFYEKLKKQQPDKEIDKELFRYSGLRPFSKETAIVMICDAIEATSKSIKKNNPSNKDLENLVDSTVERQKKDNQFSNANITLKEIEKIKEVLKKKLITLYHTRVEYPK